MDWNAIPGDLTHRELAQEFVAAMPNHGWRRAGHAFPGGARAAIWYVSRISDESMRIAFVGRPSADMAAVIAERLAQNAELKPFVRQVMVFDMLHPFQALARMQRTARVMFACIDTRPRTWTALAAVNIAYTAVVFVWLFDKTPGDMRTARFTERAMRVIGLV